MFIILLITITFVRSLTVYSLSPSSYFNTHQENKTKHSISLQEPTSSSCTPSLQDLSFISAPSFSKKKSFFNFFDSIPEFEIIKNNLETYLPEKSKLKTAFEELKQKKISIESQKALMNMNETFKFESTQIDLPGIGSFKKEGTDKSYKQIYTKEILKRVTYAYQVICEHEDLDEENDNPISQEEFQEFSPAYLALQKYLRIKLTAYQHETNKIKAEKHLKDIEEYIFFSINLIERTTDCNIFILEQVFKILLNNQSFLMNIQAQNFFIPSNNYYTFLKQQLYSCMKEKTEELEEFILIIEALEKENISQKEQLSHPLHKIQPHQKELIILLFITLFINDIQGYQTIKKNRENLTYLITKLIKMSPSETHQWIEEIQEQRSLYPIMLQNFEEKPLQNQLTTINHLLSQDPHCSFTPLCKAFLQDNPQTHPLISSMPDIQSKKDFLDYIKSTFQEIKMSKSQKHFLRILSETPTFHTHQLETAFILNQTLTSKVFFKKSPSLNNEYSQLTLYQAQQIQITINWIYLKRFLQSPIATLTLSPHCQKLINTLKKSSQTICTFQEQKEVITLQDYLNSHQIILHFVSESTSTLLEEPQLNKNTFISPNHQKLFYTAFQEKKPCFYPQLPPLPEHFQGWNIFKRHFPSYWIAFHHTDESHTKQKQLTQALCFFYHNPQTITPSEKKELEECIQIEFFNHTLFPTFDDLLLSIQISQVKQTQKQDFLKKSEKLKWKEKNNELKENQKTFTRLQKKIQKINGFFEQKKICIKSFRHYLEKFFDKSTDLQSLLLLVEKLNNDTFKEEVLKWNKEYPDSKKIDQIEQEIMEKQSQIEFIFQLLKKLKNHLQERNLIHYKHLCPDIHNKLKKTFPESLQETLDFILKFTSNIEEVQKKITTNIQQIQEVNLIKKELLKLFQYKEELKICSLSIILEFINETKETFTSEEEFSIELLNQIESLSLQSLTENKLEKILEKIPLQNTHTTLQQINNLITFLKEYTQYKNQIKKIKSMLKELNITEIHRCFVHEEKDYELIKEISNHWMFSEEDPSQYNLILLRNNLALIKITQPHTSLIFIKIIQRLTHILKLSQELPQLINSSQALCSYNLKIIEIKEKFSRNSESSQAIHIAKACLKLKEDFPSKGLEVCCLLSDYFSHLLIQKAPLDSLVLSEVKKHITSIETQLQEIKEIEKLCLKARKIIKKWPPFQYPLNTNRTTPLEEIIQVINNHEISDPQIIKTLYFLLFLDTKDIQFLNKKIKLIIDIINTYLFLSTEKSLNSPECWLLIYHYIDMVPSTNPSSHLDYIYTFLIIIIQSLHIDFQRNQWEDFSEQLPPSLNKTIISATNYIHTVRKKDPDTLEKLIKILLSPPYPQNYLSILKVDLKKGISIYSTKKTINGDYQRVFILHKNKDLLIVPMSMNEQTIRQHLIPSSLISLPSCKTLSYALGGLGSLFLLTNMFPQELLTSLFKESSPPPAYNPQYTSLSEASSFKKFLSEQPEETFCQSPLELFDTLPLKYKTIPHFFIFENYISKTCPEKTLLNHFPLIKNIQTIFKTLDLLLKSPFQDKEELKNNYQHLQDQLPQLLEKIRNEKNPKTKTILRFHYREYQIIIDIWNIINQDQLNPQNHPFSLKTGITGFIIKKRLMALFRDIKELFIDRMTFLEKNPQSKPSTLDPKNVEHFFLHDTSISIFLYIYYKKHVKAFPEHDFNVINNDLLKKWKIHFKGEFNLSISLTSLLEKVFIIQSQIFDCSINLLSLISNEEEFFFEIQECYQTYEKIVKDVFEEFIKLDINEDFKNLFLTTIEEIDSRNNLIKLLTHPPHSFEQSFKNNLASEFIRVTHQLQRGAPSFPVNFPKTVVDFVDYNKVLFRLFIELELFALNIKYQSVLKSFLVSIPEKILMTLPFQDENETHIINENQFLQELLNPTPINWTNQKVSTLRSMIFKKEGLFSPNSQLNNLPLITTLSSSLRSHSYSQYQQLNENETLQNTLIEWTLVSQAFLQHPQSPHHIIHFYNLPSQTQDKLRENGLESSHYKTIPLLPAFATLEKKEQYLKEKKAIKNQIINGYDDLACTYLIESVINSQKSIYQKVVPQTPSIEQVFSQLGIYYLNSVFHPHIVPSLLILSKGTNDPILFIKKVFKNKTQQNPEHPMLIFCPENESFESVIDTVLPQVLKNPIVSQFVPEVHFQYFHYVFNKKNTTDHLWFFENLTDLLSIEEFVQAQQQKKEATNGFSTLIPSYVSIGITGLISTKNILANLFKSFLFSKDTEEAEQQTVPLFTITPKQQTLYNSHPKYA